MSEKMLVTQALDERDLLVKKINDKISKIRLIDTKKRNEEKTAEERETVEVFRKETEGAYQQILDLIARYQRIDAAIVASNAATWIETTYGNYTVAGAIALRSRLNAGGMYARETANFEQKLMKQLEQQYQSGVQTAEARNKVIELQAENMRISILGKDSKTKDTKPLEVVDAYIRENTTEVIDPLDAVKKAKELGDKINTLLTELNTKIKVSNATTMIEF